MRYAIKNMNMNINNVNIMPNNMGMMNNNMTPYNYYSPSNLQCNLGQNKDYLLLRFNLNNVNYILKIEIIELTNTISFSCLNEDDCFTVLYKYSCFIHYEKLHNMNKAFQICDNAKQVFLSIVNTLTIDKKNITIPRIDFFQNNENALAFFFRIPLPSGQIEDVNIILKKKERNITMLFDKLAERFKEIKKIVLFNLNNVNNKILNVQNIVDPSVIHRRRGLILIGGTIPPEILDI